MRNLSLMLLLSFVVLVLGCMCSEPAVECKSPYILVGADCCLDENSDDICDRDKPIAQEPRPAIPTTDYKTLSPASTIAQAGGDANAGFERYTNSEYGFTIDLPADWEMEEDYMGSVLSILSPLKSESDNLENFNIMAVSLDGEEASLDEYLQITDDDLAAVLPDFDGIKMTRQERDSVGGIEAVRMDYEGEVEGQTILFRQLNFIHGDTAYALTYATDDAREHESIMEKTMYSIRFS